MNRDTILKEALALPVTERLDLIDELWESIGDAEQLPLTRRQKQELDRRIAEHEAHPEQAIPWNDLKQDLLKRL